MTTGARTNYPQDQLDHLPKRQWAVQGLWSSTFFLFLWFAKHYHHPQFHLQCCNHRPISFKVKNISMSIVASLEKQLQSCQHKMSDNEDKTGSQEGHSALQTALKDLFNLGKSFLSISALWTCFLQTAKSKWFKWFQTFLLQQCCEYLGLD